ncbi:hypothetical protein GCM10020366_31380 [Saccharopolyspora gregorii]|uniref:Uncharacterized protein n=1 Tax=Saccharopolyspora gregorii TaxID=33914 RepID=A0ABP6RVG6_9PSEU
MAGAQGVHAGVQGVEVGEHVACPVEDGAAGGGEVGAATGAFDEVEAEAAFEAVEAFAGGGLADPQLGGGGADAAEFGDEHEESQGQRVRIFCHAATVARMGSLALW